MWTPFRIGGHTVKRLQTAAEQLAAQHAAHQDDVTRALAARTAVIAAMHDEVLVISTLKK